METEITPYSVNGEIGTTKKATNLAIPCYIAKSDTIERFRNTGGAGYVIALDVTPLSSAPPSRKLDLGEETKATRGLLGTGVPLILKVEGGKR